MHIAQVAVNTLVWAGELGVVALGLSLSYSILGFVNFAQPEFLTVGGYIAWAAYTLMRLPIGVAAVISIVATGFVAICIDLLVFRRLRNVSAPSKMIASVGVALVLRMVVQVIFSGQARNFGLSWAPLPPIMGARITSLEVWILVLTTFSMASFYLLMSRTKMGLELRACADNFALAISRGVDGARVISLMWFISGGLGALGGIILGMETQLRPGIGLLILIPMFGAATIGGFGNTVGAVVGSLVLAIAQNAILAINFGALVGSADGWFVPVAYKDVVALLALIATLLIRPSGLFATKRDNA